MKTQEELEKELLSIKNGSSDSQHARFSLSGLKKTVECNVSNYLSRNLRSESSPWAMDGKFAHHLCECFVEAKLLGEPYPKLKPSELITYDMIKFSTDYAEYIYKTISPFLAFPYTWFIETRVHIDKEKDCWGTADFIFIYRPEVTVLKVIIVDAKYGEFVGVDTEENWQLIGYSLGAINEYTK